MKNPGPLRKARYVVEYLALRVALLLLDTLPLGVVMSIARGAGRLAFWFGVQRRHTAIANILKCGIATNQRDARRIALHAVQHFAQLVVESLKSDTLLTETNWREHITLDIPEATEKLLTEPGRGVIVVSGHLGNWEVAAQVLSFIKPVVGITRRMNNPLVDRLMQRRKPRHRFRLTPKHDADAGRFLAALKQGEILAVLADQYAGHRGMMVPFFGHRAATHTSVALLHLVTKAPLLFGYCVRTAPRHFLFKASAPLQFQRTGNREADIRAILEELNQLLEEGISAYPEQYVWAHRRWRE